MKCRIVVRDEKDKGERMLLNFGHTLGHAIEKAYDYTHYTHGEGVAIGMYQMTKLSESKGLTQKGTTEQIKALLTQYHLPYKVEDTHNPLILESIAVDKKNLDGRLNVILLKEISEAMIYATDMSFFEKGE